MGATKEEKYCYIRRKDLLDGRKKKLRIFFQYNNTNKDPIERIAVKKTGDDDRDAKNLLKLVKVENQFFKSLNKSWIETETETLNNGSSRAIIEKFFICR